MKDTNMDWLLCGDELCVDATAASYCELLQLIRLG